MSRITSFAVIFLIAGTVLAQPQQPGWKGKGAKGGAPGGLGPDGTSIKSQRSPDKEVVYKTIGTNELKVSFFFPPGWKATDKRPGIVLFFGGGFRVGSASVFFQQAEYLASRGMVAASADYRVKTRQNVAADKCFADARSALRFVRAHAAEFGIDPDKLAAGGGSSGGAMAASLAYGTGPDNPGDDLAVSTRPNALVLFNPAILISMARTDLLDGTTEEKEEVDNVLSPLKNVAKNGPPAILFYGTKDWLLKNGRDFCEKSRALGNACELYTAEGVDHGFYNRAPWHDVTLRKADEFLVSLGYLSGTPTIPADKSAVLVKDFPK